jgi:hypothetical protein
MPAFELNMLAAAGIAALAFARVPQPKTAMTVTAPVGIL